MSGGQTSSGADSREDCRTPSGHDKSTEHPAELEDLERHNFGCLEEAMKDLSPKDAELLRMHYYESKCFADIARARGVSREAVRATHARLMLRLKKVLKDRIQK